MPRGSDTGLECIVAVGQVVTRNLHGDAVELDVRTLGDVLVESRLVKNSIGTGMNAGGCAHCVAHMRTIDLGLAAIDLGVHIEARARIGSAAAVGSIRGVDVL